MKTKELNQTKENCLMKHSITLRRKIFYDNLIQLTVLVNGRESYVVIIDA